MKNNTYGVLDHNNRHIDISNSLLSAKRYATKHGYNVVTIRYDSGYIVQKSI